MAPRNDITARPGDDRPAQRSFVTWFRTRLGLRLMATFIIVALFSIIAVALLSYYLARISLIDLALSKVEQEAALTAKDLDTYLEQFFSDVLSLGDVPPVQGLIRARDNRGVDPATNESYQSWTNRLNQIFASLTRSKQFYQSLRYLDETGQELVRVDYRDGVVTIVSDDVRMGLDVSLENRAGAPYFAEARRLPADEVYISRLSLNSRDGQIEEPHAPLVHFSTPVYNRDEEFRGVVVATVYAASFLDRLSADQGQIYLANEGGFYLVHPDPAHTFGLELGTNHNVVNDFPDDVTSVDAVDEAFTILNTRRDEVVALKKIHFDPRQPERYWLLIRTLPENAVLGPVNRLGVFVVSFGAIVTGVVAFVALWLAKGFTRPVRQLTKVAAQIGRGNLAVQAPVETQDEIGVLATTFNQMTRQLQESRQELAASYTREQKRRQLSDTLREVARIVSSTLEQEKVFDLILTQLELVVVYHYATITLLANGELTLAAGRNKQGQPIADFTIPVDRYPLNALALRDKQPVLIPDIRQDDRWQATGEMGSIRSFINAPLMVQDNVAAESVIRAFGLRDFSIEQFAEKIGRGREQRKGWARFKKGLQHPTFIKNQVVIINDAQQWLIGVLAIGLGAYWVLQGSLALGPFAAFVMLVPKLNDALSQLMNFFRSLLTASSGLERMLRLMHTPPSVLELATAAPLPPFSKEIRLAGLTFGYTEEERQLKNVSVSFAAGQTTAIVGPSGSGKSTLLKLITRAYDPNSGMVLWDGHDLRKVTLASLHAQMGVVLQDVVLLNTSVRENIRLAKPDAADEEVEMAARAAEIHEAIMSFPQGYDTNVGEGGKLLSLGQRQRISLARALLRNPPILLLDEVTSALDLETEAAINLTLERLAANHTIIMVTHRLSSAVKADRVVVMEKGQVVEEGAPQELLARKGLYYELWQHQTGFLVSADGRRAAVTTDRLQAVPLFEDMDDKTLIKLAKRFVTDQYGAGQTVFSEGEPGEKFYIIVRGKVSLTTTGVDGRTIRLAVLEDGDYFGEIALMDKALHQTAAHTLQSSIFLTLERKQFKKMMKKTETLREVVEDTALVRSLTTVTSRGRTGSDASVWDDLLDDE